MQILSSHSSIEAVRCVPHGPRGSHSTKGHKPHHSWKGDGETSCLSLTPQNHQYSLTTYEEPSGQGISHCQVESSVHDCEKCCTIQQKLRPWTQPKSRMRDMVDCTPVDFQTSYEMTRCLVHRRSSTKGSNICRLKHRALSVPMWCVQTDQMRPGTVSGGLRAEQAAWTPLKLPSVHQFRGYLWGPVGQP